MKSLRIACTILLLFALCLLMSVSVGLMVLAAFPPQSLGSFLIGGVTLFFEVWAFVAVASYAMS